MHPDPHPASRPAGRDALTQLPDRQQALARLASALCTTRRHRTFTALLVIDLDGFRHLREQHGGRAADTLLRRIAAGITDSTRGRDMVARSGDDEFMVLLDGLGAPLAAAARHALQVAEKLRLAIAAPDATSASPGVTASIGMTLVRAGTPSIEAALREADVAVRRAREHGGNQVRFHDHDLQVAVERRQWLEHGLPLALDAARISLHLQPQLARNGIVTGAELLARWHDPQRGDVPPGHFIPLAEETGLIEQLGEQSLRTACEALATLRGQGESYPLSVNVSPTRLMNPAFVGTVRDILAASGTPGESLVFEVTEGLLIQDLPAVTARMRSLARLGVRFSIDDFGTGYSNLAALRRLPLYELKIDRSLVQDLPDDPQSATIMRLILSLTRRLGLRVVAEGVETQAQADFLFEHHCDALQGFLTGPPVALETWLERARPRGTHTDPPIVP